MQLNRRFRQLQLLLTHQRPQPGGPVKNGSASAIDPYLNKTSKTSDFNHKRLAGLFLQPNSLGTSRASGYTTGQILKSER